MFASLGYFFGESWTLIEKWIGRAGAVVGAVIVALIIFVRLWTWLVQHEVELRNRWALFLARPRVAAFRARFARQIDFIEGRLSPGGYLGLHLTLGAIVVLLAAGLFGNIAEDVAKNRPLVGIDATLAGWFADHATPALTRAAKMVSFAGSGPWLWTLSIAFAAWQTFQKCWHRLATLLFAVGGGALLSIALSHLFHHARPPMPNPLIEASNYNFPSGHTVGATLFYGLIGFYVAQDARRWRWRVLGPLAAGLVVLLIALSRVYLGAQYLSDVLGAMAIGTMWLAFCITAVEVDRRYRLTHPAAHGPANSA